MIAHLHGVITDKAHQLLIIDVHGVGFGVSVCDTRLYQRDQEVTLHIYYYWNQDQGPQLYGFENAFAKSVFGYIISCSGCGPKIGLAVLDHMSPHLFVQAITTGDSRTISQVHGIGPKKAELMIMQLKDKIIKIVPDNLHLAKHVSLLNVKKLSEALYALDYKQAEIAKALDFIAKNETINSSSFDALLKQALSVLAKSL